MSILVAILLTFGRLSADHEIIAMKASGISLGRIIRPILLSAMVLSVFLFILNDQIGPQSHFMVRKLSREIGMRTPAAILEEGVFIKRFKKMVLFIHRIHDNKLYGIRIYQPQENGPTRTITAKEGELIPVPAQNMIKLKLMDGISDEPKSRDSDEFYKLNFTNYYLPLNLSDKNIRGVIDKKPKEKSIRELKKEYDYLLKEHKFTAHQLMAEIHKKIVMALSGFIFALLAIPLAITMKRSEKSFGFLLAMALAGFYWLLMIGMMALAKTGTVPPAFCMHFPNILLGGIAIVLLRRQMSR